MCLAPTPLDSQCGKGSYIRRGKKSEKGRFRREPPQKGAFLCGFQPELGFRRFEDIQ